MINRVGTLPTAAFTIGKIAWLAEQEPENFRRMRRILLPHDYLSFRLTGQYVTDRSEASGTGYYDADRNEYLTEFLHYIAADVPWEEMLPRVGSPEESPARSAPRRLRNSDFPQASPWASAVVISTRRPSALASLPAT